MHDDENPCESPSKTHFFDDVCRFASAHEGGASFFEHASDAHFSSPFASWNADAALLGSLRLGRLARPFAAAFGAARWRRFGGSSLRWRARRSSCRSNVCFRNLPVQLALLSATCSGVPVATILPPPSPPSGPEVDDPVRRLDHVEIVLDDDDRVAGVDQFLQHREQFSRRQSAGRSSARRECTSCGRSRVATVPWPASRAALRRPTASSPAGRPSRSRARPRASVSILVRMPGTAPKKSRASSTVMSSTSAMVLPL